MNPTPLQCTRRQILAIGGIAATMGMTRPIFATAESGAQKKSVTARKLVFKRLIHENNDDPTRCGLGVWLEDDGGTIHRQAVVFQPNCTAAEIGAALEQLGRFLQSPDERMRVGSQWLVGCELNAADFPAPSEPSE